MIKYIEKKNKKNGNNIETFYENLIYYCNRTRSKSGLTADEEHEDEASNKLN